MDKEWAIDLTVEELRALIRAEVREAVREVLHEMFAGKEEPDLEYRPRVPVQLPDAQDLSDSD